MFPRDIFTLSERIGMTGMKMKPAYNYKYICMLIKVNKNIDTKTFCPDVNTPFFYLSNGSFYTKF